MRSDRRGLPEIIDAIERDGEFFGVVAAVFEGEAQAFEFGIDSEGYVALRKILHHRPLELTDPGSYRYFFVPRTHRLEPRTDRGEFLIRAERGRRRIEFHATGPRLLIANLTWFADLRFANEARHLRRVALRPEVRRHHHAIGPSPVRRIEE